MTNRDGLCDGPTDELPREGFVRKSQFLGRGKAIPLSNTRWYDGIQRGEFPKPIKLSANVSVWRVQDIRDLIDRFSGKAV